MAAATASERASAPEALLDLVEWPPVAALTTVMPDESPETRVIVRIKPTQVALDALDAIHA